MIHYTKEELLRLMRNAISCRQHWEIRVGKAETREQLDTALHWAHESSRLYTELFKALRSQNELNRF